MAELPGCARMPDSTLLAWCCPRFGVTQEVHQMRAAHSDQYTTFIRSKRTAAARKYLTQQEGGDKDVNLGMQPYR